MKKLPINAAAIFLSFLFIISCLKSEQSLSTENSQSQNLLSKVQPPAPNCGSGYIWDFYLGKCVPICPSGQHNDSTTGACVPNGSSKHIYVVTNPNNPDDQYGNYHNQGVAAIFPNINPQSPTLNTDVLTQVKNFDITLGYSADSAQIFYNNMVSLGNLPYTVEPELDSLGNKLYSQGLISSNANNYVQRIYSLALTYLNVDVPTVALYNSFATNLITIEGQIKTDNTITVNERNVLLSSCSIGRYSAAYWGNYINNPVQSLVKPPKLRLSFWMKVLIGDIGGGIIGITMGPVGIITGAVGTSIVVGVSL